MNLMSEESTLPVPFKQRVKNLIDANFTMTGFIAHRYGYGQELAVNRSYSLTAPYVRIAARDSDEQIVEKLKSLTYKLDAKREKERISAEQARFSTEAHEKIARELRDNHIQILRKAFGGDPDQPLPQSCRSKRLSDSRLVSAMNSGSLTIRLNGDAEERARAMVVIERALDAAGL